MAGSAAIVDTRSYYNNYSGHPIPDLRVVKIAMGDRAILYTAGDSSLDNKFWLLNTRFEAAVNGYERVLNPPQMVGDINYWLNNTLAMRRGAGESSDQQQAPPSEVVAKQPVNSPPALPSAAINTAVEASLLSNRVGCCGRLLAADMFVRDNITEDDYLLVSVGGNDVVLCPSCCTVCNMVALAHCASLSSIESGQAYCLHHFVRMFKSDVTTYINKLVAKRKPKKIAVCMIYFPDESQPGSWADTALCCLGYNSNPKQLQATIAKIFEKATCEINIDGCEVIPFPMFEVLDGKTPSDYIQRVEPSVSGGRKIAQDALYRLGL